MISIANGWISVANISKPKKTPKTKITVKAPDPSAKKAEKPKKVVKPPKAKAEEKDEESAEPELTEKAKLERREKAGESLTNMVVR